MTTKKIGRPTICNADVEMKKVYEKIGLNNTPSSNSEGEQKEKRSRGRPRTIEDYNQYQKKYNDSHNERSRKARMQVEVITNIMKNDKLSDSQKLVAISVALDQNT